MAIEFPGFKVIRSIVRTGALLVGLGLASGAQALEGPLYYEPSPQYDPSTPLQKSPNPSHRASELALHALGTLGVRYKFGGDEPETGLDCSGLVRYVFRQAWGADLPRTSEEISRIGDHVDTSELQPGDLVFYNTMRRRFSHVGIYLGDSKFIHAPSGGGQVRIESMNLSYWKQRFNGARRILDPQQQ